MKIPTSIFYQPLIHQSMFNAVIQTWSPTEQLAAQKEVLSYLDSVVILKVCAMIDNYDDQVVFLQRCQLIDQQGELLDSLMATYPQLQDELEEVIERALLILYSKIKPAQS